MSSGPRLVPGWPTQPATAAVVGRLPQLLQQLPNSMVGFDYQRANLLRNGGFEQWTRGNGPFTQPGQECADGWLIRANPLGETGSVERVDSTAPTGSMSAVRIVGTSVDASLIQQTIDPAVCALAGLPVSLSFWVNAPVGCGIQAVVGVVGQVGFTYDQPVAGTGDWQILRISGNVPDVRPPEAVLVVIGAYGAYTVSYDNVSLVVGEVATDYFPSILTAPPWNGTTVPVANGGTGQTTAKAARESGLLDAGYFSTATHAAGTTISIPQATHGLRAARGLIVQCQIEATGAVVTPDIVVAATGDVTATFGQSQAANSIRVTILG